MMFTTESKKAANIFVFVRASNGLHIALQLQEQHLHSYNNIKTTGQVDQPPACNGNTQVESQIIKLTK